jgi:hypothetical protein
LGRLPNARAAVFVVCATLASGGKAMADFVIADDLIVQGSTCTGLDCVDGESFGFDTLKLKENNLRIFFQDTSVSAGFPSNDWRIIVNDSASGGANFFAIEDSTAARQVFRVDAGARADSIHVDSSGRVGLGTATPVLLLHERSSDTPGHRFEQDASGGFTAQTWDIGANEANFFVRDVTGGSRLSLRIRPGAPTSSIDIAASGAVGLGTASPGTYAGVPARLDIGNTGSHNLANVNAATAFSANLALSENGTCKWLLSSRNTFDAPNNRLSMFAGCASEVLTVSSVGNVGIGANNPAARLHTIGTVRFAGVANCASGIVSNASGDLSCLASSRQLKNVDGSLAPDRALANVMALRPQVGAYKATPDEPEHWLIAEEVAAVDPALVGLRDGAPYTVKLQNVVADLIAVVQQQQRRIEALEKALAR